MDASFNPGITLAMLDLMIMHPLTVLPALVYGLLARRAWMIVVGSSLHTFAIMLFYDYPADIGLGFWLAAVIWAFAALAIQSLRRVTRSIDAEC